MLHELLFALNGHPGSIFTKNEENDIHVTKDLPNVHPSEVALLNRLCRLATYYSRFKTFIQDYGPLHTQNGLYMKGFCNGLDKVLSPYRSTLVELEQQLMCQPHLTATHIQHELEKYQLLFPALSSFLDQLIQQKVHGCYMLEMLHRASASGVPLIKTTFLEILHVCHLIFYKQLTSWMLYGQLLDHYGEFIISKQPAAAVSAVSENDNTSEERAQPLLDMLQDGSTGQTCQFTLCSGRLPSYIPHRIAASILFVGESMQLIESKVQNEQRGSIMSTKEKEFARDLFKLSRQPNFVLRDFETVIDRIRTFVAEQLWKLVVEDGDLLNYLRLVKDFFLLGRGELFLAFIDRAHQLLHGPPTVSTQHDVNIAFQHAAHNVLFENETFLQMFSFEVKSKQDQPPGESGWKLLNLRYSVQWPLHVFFTQTALSRYNCLFRFLLWIKRLQLQLQHGWAVQMWRKQYTRDNFKQWWLRNHMAFLVDNLQYYLQVDVIESQYSILQDKVENLRDFEAIRLAHVHFLHNLLSQSFLLSLQMSHCLTEVLDVCQSFCQLVNHSEVQLSSQEESQLDKISENFQYYMQLLMTVLSDIHGRHASPHLAQLLLRLDYNGFFTKKQQHYRTDLSAVDKS